MLAVITLKKCQLARRESKSCILHAPAPTKRNQLVGVIKYSHGSGGLPKEVRDGDRISHKSVAKKDCVKTLAVGEVGKSKFFSKVKSKQVIGFRPFSTAKLADIKKPLKFTFGESWESVPKLSF